MSSERHRHKMVFHDVRRMLRGKKVHIQISVAGIIRQVCFAHMATGEDNMDISVFHQRN